MKSVLFKSFILIGLLLVSNITEAKRKLIKPHLHNKKVKIQSGTKEPTEYYSLSKKYATSIKVGGPGKVTVFLRTLVPEGSVKSKKFNLKYTIDGKKVKVRTVKPMKVSKKAKLVGKEAQVSVVYKVNLTIPPGRHKIDFISLNNSKKVFSKFYFEKYPAPKWKDQVLSKSTSEVTLVTAKQKKKRKYQRINSRGGIKFKAKEKTYLRLMFRGEFKAHMFADNTLRLHIKENGKIIRTIQISSSRSKSVVYEKGGKLVPGTLNKFYMQVPKGDHEYEVVVADKNKSALIKVSYDEKRYPKKKGKKAVKSKKKKS